MGLSTRILTLFISFQCLHLVLCTRDQCQNDCGSSTSTRLVGPTRPWHESDDLGNILQLTRPYPYHIAGSDVTAIRFNVTSTSSFNISDMTFSKGDLHKHVTMEKKGVINVLREVLSNYSSCRLKVIGDTIDEAIFSP